MNFKVVDNNLVSERPYWLRTEQSKQLINYFIGFCNLCVLGMLCTGRSVTMDGDNKLIIKGSGTSNPECINNPGNIGNNN